MDLFVYAENQAPFNSLERVIQSRALAFKPQLEQNLRRDLRNL
jgi:hypothetical protein